MSDPKYTYIAGLVPFVTGEAPFDAGLHQEKTDRLIKELSALSFRAIEVAALAMDLKGGGDIAKRLKDIGHIVHAMYDSLEFKGGNFER